MSPATQTMPTIADPPMGWRLLLAAFGADEPLAEDLWRAFRPTARQLHVLKYCTTRGRGIGLSRIFQVVAPRDLLVAAERAYPATWQAERPLAVRRFETEVLCDAIDAHTWRL